MDRNKKRELVYRFFNALLEKDYESLELIKEEMKNVLKEEGLIENKTIPNDSKLMEIGDEVVLFNEFTLGYFIDEETDKQLSQNFQPLSKAITELYCSKKMLVVKNNIDKTYNCGHCSNEHHHDLVVFVPAVNRTYYASSDYFTLVEKE